MSNQQRVRIELTPEQKEQIKQASGQDCDTIELRVDELEQRIAPVTGGHHPDWIEV